jgi:hypothetical protein|uniref:Uncharacterized protein n=1 Tax=Siphoviridae sp. ctLNL10 TaxID=2825453 RepID=A0A8S5Q3C4_9CAUD|nr:MAG TPA: hypothetical protein [Siphoviridae sp. ctLNL10]
MLFLITHWVFTLLLFWIISRLFKRYRSIHIKTLLIEFDCEK